MDKGLTAVVTPEEVRVVVFGPLPALDSLAEDEVRVTVDAFGLLTGTYNLEPVVSLPDRGIELRSVQPQLVTVIITAAVTDTLTQTVRPTPTPTSWRPLPPTRQRAAKQLTPVQIIWPAMNNPHPALLPEEENLCLQNP